MERQIFYWVHELAFVYECRATTVPDIHGSKSIIYTFKYYISHNERTFELLFQLPLIEIKVRLIIRTPTLANWFSQFIKCRVWQNPPLDNTENNTLIDNEIGIVFNWLVQRRSIDALNIKQWRQKNWTMCQLVCWCAYMLYVYEVTAVMALFQVSTVRGNYIRMSQWSVYYAEFLSLSLPFPTTLFRCVHAQFQSIVSSPDNVYTSNAVSMIQL